jgi:RNA polymerase sigma-70 factor (ECF subfamily)
VKRDLTVFEQHRPALVALAYRMLGDMSRAEDLVQEAWLRWDQDGEQIETPRAYLLTVVTRLCFNELDSARARKEESRSDRLPEPVALEPDSARQAELAEQVSMAFLVLLQRLTPAERAVFLLHEVFDIEHAEIARMLGKTEPAARQLLSRARESVAAERRSLEVVPEHHRQMLKAFVEASQHGELAPMMELLADDATLIVDPGPGVRRFGRIRNVGRPIEGPRRIAAFVASVGRSGAKTGNAYECVLNGQPAIVYHRDGRPQSALLLSIVDGRIQTLFLQADPARLKHVGQPSH